MSPLAAPAPHPQKAFDPQGAARSRRWRCGKVMSLAELDSPPTQSDAGLAYLLVTPVVLTPQGGGTPSVRRCHDASELHASTPSLFTGGTPLNLNTATHPSVPPDPPAQTYDRRLRHPVGTGCHLHDGAWVRRSNVMRALWCVGVRPHHAIAKPHSLTSKSSL